MKSEIKIVKSIIDIQKEEQMGDSLKLLKKDLIDSYLKIENLGDDEIDFLKKAVNNFSYGEILWTLTTGLKIHVEIAKRKINQKKGVKNEL